MRSRKLNLRNIAISLTLLSLGGYILTGLIDGYFYTSHFRLQYGILLILVAFIALTGFIFSVISFFKNKGKARVALIFCALATLIIAFLEIASFLMSNAVRGL